MSFEWEYFQQNVGIIMGTDVAPVLANVYMAMLENELCRKCVSDPNKKWPICLKRFIDVGFGMASPRSEHSVIKDTQ